MKLSPVSRAAGAFFACALGLAGCSSINEKLQGDKVDYKTSAAKSVSLEVPPDLTQLNRDSRYQPTGGSISAAALQTPAAPGVTTPGAPGAAASAPNAVAPAAYGDVQLERAGAQRWIATKQTPEQLWPQLQAFWAERGFALDVEQKDVGVMETNWNENRAKLPQDFIRSTIGRVFDGLYDTGERDRFRTRIERGADGGSEIYISHRGMVEVYTDERKGSTMWQPRPSDPELEAIMLSRLMLKLGAKEEQARAAEAAATVAAAAPAAVAPPAARARMVGGEQGSSLQVDDGFDRAWRRVGLALDRGGFTVEDRDRAQGLYFVRYVEPGSEDAKEPGFFSRIFGGGNDKDKANALARYRIAVKGQTDTSTVTVLNNQGATETGPAAKRILERLVTDLR
ncbi:MAG TPA: outer membrane protein assembly factor BamC [Methylibium sp.]|uniref:outer membrane protein assembly factor BamC n=1 Tax=Methylibium sp. TaxID=2067992 RepID=UPI002DBF9351|nr:outer membrane protein assembly factor BamC [Methylibium sp.]HEU4459391.1 outer membrane protein assembly factor BamC [Methylibium sp.]